MSYPAIPLLPVSWGEVFDKLTILKIKSKKIDDALKLVNINKELQEIEIVVSVIGNLTEDLKCLVNELQAINECLWDVEDGKRSHERRKVFDQDFIDLARQVYIKNDERAKIKKKINELLGSGIVEEKSYASY